MNAYTARICLFLFGSGFCALVYQIAWLRMLRLVFGSSTGSSAAVLAIFMGGLGLGGYLLGKRGERSANPLGLYANLEFGISVAAAVSVWLIAAVRAVYIGVGGTFSLGTGLGSAVQLLLGALVLAVPTFLMGGTLPATVRAVTRAADHGRHSVGLLYASNTLGAVAGAWLTTFVLLELVGIRQTIWLAAALNVLIALAARSLARERGMLEEPPKDDGRQSHSSRTEEPPATVVGDRHQLHSPGTDGSSAGRLLVPVPNYRLVLLAACVVGFVFFLMELVWYRMMGPILGGSTYTFGIILTVALLGIGLGGLLYGVVGTKRPTGLHFAATCALEALCFAIPFALGDRLAFAALELRDLQAAGFGALAASWALVTCVVVLPAAIVAGYQFPVLVAILGGGRKGIARQVGLTYAWNTVGAILGSIAGGFGLIPLLSAPTTWRLAVVLLVALAAVFIVASRPSRARDARRDPGPAEGPGAEAAVDALPSPSSEHSAASWLPAAVAGALALLFILASGPTAFWRHSGIGAGRLEGRRTNPNELRDLMHSHRRALLWEVDGRESSVGIKKDAGYAFFVNGKSDGSARGDAPTQVMSGLVGAMLHPSPKQSLVIGLGTGSSSGWLAAVPTMERVDTIELEPAILRVAEECAPVNLAALDNPKVHVVIADGREFLLTSDRAYDVIFSEPSNPYRAGVASLFTREFYEAAADGLAEGGIFIQWLQGYEVDAQVVRTAYATLGTVFPHVETWQVHNSDLLMVASRTPIEHDVERTRERVASEPYATALQAVWGVGGAEGFYSGFLASAAFAGAVVELESGSVNTDDHPIIEFGFARHVGRKGRFSITQLRELAAVRGEDRPELAGGELDWDLVGELRESRSLLLGRWDPARGSLAGERLARSKAREAYSKGDLDGAWTRWAGQSGEPLSRADLALTAEASAEAGEERTPQLAARLAELQPAEARAALARWHHRQGRSEVAIEELVLAVEGFRTDPWPAPALIQRTLALGLEMSRRRPEPARRLAAALAEPLALWTHDESRMRLRAEIARHAGPGHCAEALSAFEPWVPWAEGFLRLRRDCYRQASHPLADRAERQLGDFHAGATLQMWWGLLPEEEVEAEGLELPDAGGSTRSLPGS